MMRYGWAPAQDEENNMYTRQEYLDYLENTDVSIFLAKIDIELRAGKRFIGLGRLPNMDAFPVIQKKIIASLKEAGWKCEVKVSTCRDDEGTTYVRITN